MTISTRAGLVTAVNDTLWNLGTITSTQTDLWIQMCEAQMQRRLPTRKRVGRNGAFSIASEFVNVPSDFAGIVGMELTSPVPVARLVGMTPDQLVNERNGRNTLTGQPYCFAVVGSQFRFFLAPDATYTAELEYYQRFTALTGASDTNWVLTDHPDAYLYGTLLQSAPWLHEDDRVPTWAGLFKQVLDDIVEQDKSEQPGSTLQVTPSNVFGWNNRA